MRITRAVPSRFLLWRRNGSVWKNEYFTTFFFVLYITVLERGELIFVNLFFCEPLLILRFAPRALRPATADGGAAVRHIRRGNGR